MSRVSYDLVIVGWGVSSIALLDGLKDKEKLKIAVIESGFQSFSIGQQQLNMEGDNDGAYFPLASTRIRQAGGTANHWSGVCGRIPESELEKWEDFGFKEYYPKAEDLIGLPTPVANHIIKSSLSTYIWNLAPYDKVLAHARQLQSSSSGVSWLWGSTVIGFSKEGENVFVEYRDSDNNAHQIYCKKLVLAAGGIENARLLMLNNPDLANRYNIGRNFCEHPHSEVGVFFANSKGIKYVSDFFKSTSKFFRGFRYSSTEGDVGLFLTPREVDERFDWIASRFSRLKSDFKDGGFNKSMVYNVGDILSSPFTSIRYVNERINYASAFSIKLMSSQRLVKENGLYLTSQKDRFDCARVALRWRLEKEDLNLITSAVKDFSDFLITEGLGVIKFHDWYVNKNYTDYSFVGGFHHMCTTKKGSDNYSSLTLDNEVKEMPGVYVVGSSAFERPSFINPTLTIAAMSYEFANKILDL